MMLSVMACQKEKSIVTPDGTHVTSSAFTAGIGSYFVYNIFEIDSNGQETPYGIPDTIFVVGDTLLNGHRFLHLRDQWFNLGQISTFLRDSSEFIVDRWGIIRWASANLADTIRIDQGNSILKWFGIGRVNQSFVLPAGTLNGQPVASKTLAAFELQMHHYYTNGNRISLCDSTFVQKELFVAGIGMVRNQLIWVSSHYADCKYYERRLVHFVINK